MVDEHIVIDTLGLINPDASGKLSEIISSLPVPVIVTRAALKEEIKILAKIEEEAGAERIRTGHQTVSGKTSNTLSNL